MSFPYPKDRARDKRTKGDQPYEDDRETYAEKQAKIARKAPLEHDEAADRVTAAELEHDAEERFEQIGENVSEQQGDGGNTRGDRS